MKYQVKRGYSYVDVKTKKVAGEGTELDPKWELDKTQFWKLEPSKIVPATEEIGMVTKDMGQQDNEPPKDVEGKEPPKETEPSDEPVIPIGEVKPEDVQVY